MPPFPLRCDEPTVGCGKCPDAEVSGHHPNRAIWPAINGRCREVAAGAWSGGAEVRHDDPEREFAYTSAAEQALEQARTNGWTVISINPRLDYGFPAPINPSRRMVSGSVSGGLNTTTFVNDRYKPG
jgi:hypothetical protein